MEVEVVEWEREAQAASGVRCPPPMGWQETAGPMPGILPRVKETKMAPTIDAKRGAPTRERILREASRLFATRGYYGTSTREIATAVGVSQPSLFYHFDSKHAIMQALLDFDLGEPTEVAERLERSKGSAATRLYRYLVWDIAFLCRSPYNLAGITDDTVMSDPDFAPWKDRLDRLRSARRSMIEQAIADGEFVEVDPDLAQRAITWMILGNIADLAGRGVPNADEVADQLASFAIRAMLRDLETLDDIRSGAASIDVG